MSTKLTYDFIKQYIESFGYKLLSNEYPNSGIKLQIQCLEGHVYKAAWNTFQAGHRCKKCKYIKHAINERLPYNDVKNYIENTGYKLLDDTYSGVGIKLKMMCQNNHICHISYDNYKHGRRCGQCYQKKQYTYIDAKNYIESSGYKKCQFLSKGQMSKRPCLQHQT